MKISLSSIVTAFDTRAIGSKVTDHSAFLDLLRGAVAAHDFAADRVPGQGFVMIPGAEPFVSAGVGPRTNNEGDYIVRSHRGRVDAYLTRAKAAPTEGCAAVVYTAQAYLLDPDIHEVAGEAERIRQEGATHVLVAVLAFAGPSTTYGVHRFVANLAGGNKEALVWLADEIRAKAEDVIAYDSAWVTVAD